MVVTNIVYSVLKDDQIAEIERCKLDEIKENKSIRNYINHAKSSAMVRSYKNANSRVLISFKVKFGDSGPSDP